MKTRKTRNKIWVGVGACVVIGAGASIAAETVPGVATLPGPAADAAAVHERSGRLVVAQHGGADHGDMNKANQDDAGEGNEAQAIANLPPELAFAVRIALLRGHLLVGDELVKQQQWNAALPHFLHPGEELYGDLKDQLAGYQVPPFDGALKKLADVIKAKKAGNDYTIALKAVNDALVAADAGMKAKHQANWSGYVTEAAVEALKSATSEYQQAIVNGRIAKPVEYQDARGFIWNAERMIESVAPDLQKKDPAALAEVRAGFATLKKAFPSPLPPKTPVNDAAAVLGDVGRIELAAGKLM
jgi:hypothetical protein